jgi:protocatechuate 3,4-dioxygenase, beta subunit
MNEYYIDDIEFEDDPLLTPAERARRPKRGGAGITSLTKNADGSWSGQRNIVLGMNIPGCPD